MPAATVEALRARYMPEMPPLDRGEYLITYLLEIGPTVAAGMSVGPITQGEIRAWQDNIGIELAPWEVRFLRRLSGEYLAESHRAEKRGCKAPYQSADAPPEVSDTQAAIRALVKL